MTNKINGSEILTLSEVAQYLKIAEKTVLRMAHRGEIPAAKVGNQWRFLKPLIDNWLIAKMDNVPLAAGFARLIESPETNLIPFARLLHESFIILSLTPGAKEEVLNQLVAPLIENNLIGDRDGYVRKLLAREQMLSTAMEHGIAIPHIRNPKENPPGITLIVVGRCQEGTDFDSLDNEKTRLFFLILSDSEALHIRVLAKISKILLKQETIDAIMNAKTEREIIDIISRQEQELVLKL
jgi:excisionase family DNA binding protein